MKKLKRSKKKKIAINTSGGDAPGLNAVIRAVVLSAKKKGWDVFGIKRGFAGLIDRPDLVDLNADHVRGIAHLGGTVLGAANKGHPFQFPVKQEDGSVVPVDRSGEIIKKFKENNFDALITIGGDGSLKIAKRLFDMGLPIVGVPKTIDNDLAATFSTFGFDTAVTTATECLDKLHSTAEAHSRIFVVEVMGRYAGWIALNAGVSAAAHIVLIPEIPFDIEKVCEAIKKREERGRDYTIIVVAEGAFPKNGSIMTMAEKKVGEEVRLGGISLKIADEISKKMEKETRTLVLGHLQRGGNPTPFDRLIALRFGSAAVQAVEDENFGCMVALNPPNINTVPIEKAISEMKTVPLASDTVSTARSLGISFGD